MVATHVEPGQRTDEVYNLVGTGTVTNDIAEVPENIEWSCLEYGLQCFEIPVDVGEDEGAHSVSVGIDAKPNSKLIWICGWTEASNLRSRGGKSGQRKGSVGVHRWGRGQ